MMLEWGAERLHFTVEGAGPALLFLHGLGGTAGNWLHQRRYFAATHRVIALDLPGHGRSTGIEVPFGDYALAIEAVVKHCAVEQVSIVGLAAGARAGLAFAASRPAQVPALVIVNAFLRLTPEDHRRNVELYDLLLQPNGVTAWGEALLSKMGMTAHPGINRSFMRSLSGVDASHLRRIFSETLDSDQEDQLANVPAEVLLIRGERDDLIPAYTIEDMSALHPGTRIARFPELGHLPYLEDPAAFNAAVAAFLRPAQSPAETSAN
ncbi:alpha/beta hydrolase [Micromonospora sp. NPDC049101]|uniref:alpha/beta fold hydrolase n=1 Tax=Micromonospora sp. NPDC049101 TaxID=3155032 RepID=UPI0033DBAFC5